MDTIAAKQLRSGMVRRRPPYLGRGGAGSNGSTSAHSSSGHEIISEDCPGAASCQTYPKGAKRRLRAIRQRASGFESLGHLTVPCAGSSTTPHVCEGFLYWDLRVWSSVP